MAKLKGSFSIIRGAIPFYAFTHEEIAFPQEQFTIEVEADSYSDLYDSLSSKSHEIEMNFNLFLISQGITLNKSHGYYYFFNAQYPDLFGSNQGYGFRIQFENEITERANSHRNFAINLFLRNLKIYKRGKYNAFIPHEYQNMWSKEGLKGSDLNKIVEAIGEERFEKFITSYRKMQHSGIDDKISSPALLNKRPSLLKRFFSNF